MATQAWPFAVTKGAMSGYQAIVVPPFLADGQAYILEYATREETGEPGSVTVREVHGATLAPLSLAYRVTEARADRYGLDRDVLLEDQAGRAIRVFEGLVLRLPAVRVLSAGLTEQDLNAVTEVTIPAFRKLWAAGERIDAEPSAAISVGSSVAGGRLLNLQATDPYVVPGSHPERAMSRRIRPGDRPVVPAPSRPAADRRTESRGSRRRRGSLIPVIVAACALAALVAWFVGRPSAASAQTTVQHLCSDLRNGNASAAYQQFSNGYRHSTSLRVFDSTLLGSSARASCTSMTTAADQATLSLRRADGVIRTVHLELLNESGRWQIAAMKVSP